LSAALSPGEREGEEGEKAKRRKIKKEQCIPQ
jgi:hypothetical protein